MGEEKEGSWVEGREMRRNKRVVEGWERTLFERSFHADYNGAIPSFKI